MSRYSQRPRDFSYLSWIASQQFSLPAGEASVPTVYGVCRNGRLELQHAKTTNPRSAYQTG
jgi:hypothetical protein